MAVLCACAGSPRPLVLASTTSTEDSGLFDVLLPAFAREHPEHALRLVAVGSGQALEMGARGDADVLLVHSPAAELEFMRAGHGVDRRAVMANDFVLLGPRSDPAGVRGATIERALTAIAARGGPFISRGDNSGTHARERSLWRAAGVVPDRAPWYREVGQGMGETLAIAAERRAYTLADRATFLFTAQAGGLEVLAEGERALQNPYTVITATRAHNAAGARTFAAWLTSPGTQRLIGTYGLDRFGVPLFTPTAR